MLFYTGLFLLVIAVSIDGLGVGISYGMQRTRVPFLAILIIMLSSGLIVLAAMTIGDILEQLITPAFSEMLAGIVLITLGVITLVNLLKTKKKPSTPHQDVNTFTNMKKVFTSPAQADLDQSGTISTKEAILLGFALALDAFGAGIAASLLNYSPLLTSSLVALMSGGFLYVGMKIGLLLSKQQKNQIFSYIPPLLLITIGILNLF